MKAGITHLRYAWRLATAIAVALIAIGWIALHPSLGEADAVADAAAPNPHWRADGCGSCHAMAGGKPQSIANTEVDHLCLRCHDGEHASAEVHPTAHLFQSDRYVLPAKWPLVEGRLSCLTCHDVHKACKISAGIVPEYVMFLRGGEELNPTITQRGDFCQNCHKSDRAREFDPHLMLDSRGQIIENRCLFCHDKVPDRNAMNWTGNAHLRFGQLVLCKSCHPTHEEILKNGHWNIKVNDEFAAYMRAREIVGLIVEPSEALD